MGWKSRPPLNNPAPNNPYHLVVPAGRTIWRRADCTLQDTYRQLPPSGRARMTLFLRSVGDTMGFLAGKRLLVTGVLSNRSIA
jgi:hypothetical protein